MGLFGGKKDSLSLSEAEELLGNPRALKGKSKKEIEDLKRRARGEVKRGGDIRAGLSDLKNGRKGAQGVGKAPEPRKGRSMWS